MESSVRLRITNETTGTYYCHVNNTVGEDTCHLEITERMMTAGISTMDLYIILIVVLCVIVIFALVLACYYFHRKHAGRQQVEWFDAKTHSSTTDEGLKRQHRDSVDLNLDEGLKRLHRDSVDLNLILRKGDKMAK